jgi:transcriptional regulator with PAS, ATPase and Fis domain
MTRYAWPGNVREIENEIERAMTLAHSEGGITEEHLSEKIKASPGKGAVQLDGIEGGTLQEVTERIEQEMIVKALSDSGGNRSQAARMLGLTRQGLLNKIARYKIQS